MSFIKDKTDVILERLELYKDFDPYYQGLLNDCSTVIQGLQAEVDRLKQLNRQLNHMVTQLESEDYERS